MNMGPLTSSTAPTPFKKVKFFMVPYNDLDSLRGHLLIGANFFSLVKHLTWYLISFIWEVFSFFFFLIF